MMSYIYQTMDIHNQERPAVSTGRTTYREHPGCFLIVKYTTTYSSPPGCGQI